MDTTLIYNIGSCQPHEIVRGVMGVFFKDLSQWGSQSTALSLLAYFSFCWISSIGRDFSECFCQPCITQPKHVANHSKDSEHSMSRIGDYSFLPLVFSAALRPAISASNMWPRTVSSLHNILRTQIRSLELLLCSLKFINPQIQSPPSKSNAPPRVLEILPLGAWYMGGGLKAVYTYRLNGRRMQVGGINSAPRRCATGFQPLAADIDNGCRLRFSWGLVGRKAIHPIHVNFLQGVVVLPVF